MNRQRIGFVIGLMVLTFGLWKFDLNQFTSNQKSAKNKMTTPTPFVLASSPQIKSHLHPSSSPSHLKESAGSARVPAGTPNQQKMQENMQNMVLTLSQFSKPKASITDLVSHLEKSKQKPVVTRDANPSTGEMHIVRTLKPSIGTRYFHAQFFTNDDGSSFAQHLSVEFKGGPEAMTNTIAAVQNSFGLTSPRIQNAGYALWDLPNNMIVWVKSMTREDLHDDPFNAYSDSDVGTVRLAVEAEIH